jgi:hypothetical protein
MCATCTLFSAGLIVKASQYDGCGGGGKGAVLAFCHSASFLMKQRTTGDESEDRICPGLPFFSILMSSVNEVAFPLEASEHPCKTDNSLELISLL